MAANETKRIVKIFSHSGNMQYGGPVAVLVSVIAAGAEAGTPVTSTVSGIGPGFSVFPSCRLAATSVIVVISSSSFMCWPPSGSVSVSLMLVACSSAGESPWCPGRPLFSFVLWTTAGMLKSPGPKLYLMYLVLRQYKSSFISLNSVPVPLSQPEPAWAPIGRLSVHYTRRTHFD